MGRKLAVTVYLDGDGRNDDGSPKVLLAGSEPTAEEAKSIDNPDVWEDDESDQKPRASRKG